MSTPTSEASPLWCYHQWEDGWCVKCGEREKKYG